MHLRSENSSAVVPGVPGLWWWLDEFHDCFCKHPKLPRLKAVVKKNILPSMNCRSAMGLLWQSKSGLRRDAFKMLCRPTAKKPPLWWNIPIFLKVRTYLDRWYMFKFHISIFYYLGLDGLIYHAQRTWNFWEFGTPQPSKRRIFRRIGWNIVLKLLWMEGQTHAVMYLATANIRISSTFCLWSMWDFDVNSNSYFDIIIL